jgi:hypothetical protein
VKPFEGLKFEAGMRRLAAILAVSFAAACGSDTDPSGIPDLSGNWGGFFSVSSCTEQDHFVNFCSALGSSRALILVLTQTNDQVAGTLQLATTQTPVTGTVGHGGSLTLAGSGPVLADLGRMTLVTWHATLDQSNSLSGSLHYTITAVPPLSSGSSDVVGVFADVRR